MEIAADRRCVASLKKALMLSRNGSQRLGGGHVWPCPLDSPNRKLVWLR